MLNTITLYPKHACGNSKSGARKKETFYSLVFKNFFCSISNLIKKNRTITIYEIILIFNISYLQ